MPLSLLCGLKFGLSFFTLPPSDKRRDETHARREPALSTPPLCSLFFLKSVGSILVRPAVTFFLIFSLLPTKIAIFFGQFTLGVFCRTIPVLRVPFIVFSSFLTCLIPSSPQFSGNYQSSLDFDPGCKSSPFTRGYAFPREFFPSIGPVL